MILTWRQVVLMLNGNGTPENETALDGVRNAMAGIVNQWGATFCRASLRWPIPSLTSDTCKSSGCVKSGEVYIIFESFFFSFFPGARSGPPSLKVHARAHVVFATSLRLRHILGKLITSHFRFHVFSASCILAGLALSVTETYFVPF